LAENAEKPNVDLLKAIKELRLEKDRLDYAIALLEELQSATDGNLPLKPWRGRKSMIVEERSEVSARMKKYWAKRRLR
jgi:hypothetical protein